MSRSTTRSKPKAIVFYLIQMIYSFSLNLTFQILPIFARKLGGTEVQLGILTAVQNVTSSFFQPLFGYLSDRRGRRVFLVLSAFTMTLSGVVLIFSQNATQVIIIVGFSSLGMSLFWPAWNGTIADYTRSKKITLGDFLGKIYSASSIYISLTFVLLILYFQFSEFDELLQYRLILVVAALNFFFFLIVSFFVFDSVTTSEENTGDSEGEDNGTLDPPSSTKSAMQHALRPLKDKRYTSFLTIILFWWFWMSLAWPYFGIFLVDVLDVSLVQLLILSLPVTIFQSIFARVYSHYSHVLSTSRILMISLIPFAFVPLLFSISTQWWHIILPQILAGIAIGAGFSALQAYILEVAGEEHSAYYTGTYQITWGAVTFAGSLLGGYALGYLKDYFGSIATALTLSFFTIFLLRMISDVFLILFLPDSKTGATVSGNILSFLRRKKSS